MKPFAAFLIALAVGCIASPQQRLVTIQEVDGGSAVTQWGQSFINKGSSLHRKWFVINESSCPVQLSEMGVRPQRAYPSSFEFVLAGGAYAQKPISAVQIVIVTFNLWGEHMRNLAHLSIGEVAASAALPPSAGSWYASENDVQELMTTACYVRRVRTADGIIWKADARDILEKLATVQLKVSQEEIEPQPSPGVKK